MPGEELREALDSTVLVAALARKEAHHRECASLLRRGGLIVNMHALSETFSALTGGRLEIRLSAVEVRELFEIEVLPYVSILQLTLAEFLYAMQEAPARGVRGGAIYDYLHLVAARCAAAPRIYTLNMRHFESFHRPGDPEIVHP